jgi:hypothetical protein
VSAYGRQHAGGQLSTPKLPSDGVQPVIVHVYVAGVGSTLPATSFARTENVCDPVASPAA